MIEEQEKKHKELIFGPWRIMPGSLSVSRTIGDLSSKVKFLGGAENVIIPNPEVYDCDLSDTDFVIPCFWKI